MKTGLIAAFAGGAMMLLTVPSLSFANNAASSPPASAESGAAASSTVPGTAIPAKITPDYLLNWASRMNHDEIRMMNLAHDKAGSNQALKTLATTVKGDHQANQDAVKALAEQENVDLKDDDNGNNAAYNRLDNLNGAAFNEAFLNHEIKDHQHALSVLKQAENQPENRAMETYISQTIPVLRAHLQMARNLKQDMSAMGSPENPANNTRNNGNSNNGND